MSRVLLASLIAGAAAVSAHAEMRITEWMYQGPSGEFIEFTNIGAAPVDMTGWSFDDDSRNPFTVDVSVFGVVQPGQSVLLTEASAAGFTAAWGLGGVAILGNNSTNLGRNDEINLYDAAGQLVDRLTYGDEVFPGTIRTQNKSGWTFEGNVGKNNIHFWVLAAPGDAQGSVTAASGEIGNPGFYTPVAPTQSFARFNEIYASHAGTDDQEFIELYGVPGGPLSHVMVLVVEGEGANAGMLDRAFDLTGQAIALSDNYFVLGNGAVPGLDLDIGPANVLENGTETFYLIEAVDPAAVSARVGTNVTAGPGATLLPSLGSVLDMVAMIDGDEIQGADLAFDLAQALGPDGKSQFPAGIYRGGDWPAPWCGAFLDFDPVANLLQARTPGAANSPCHVLDYGAGCAGSGGFTPRVQVRGDTAAGGAVEFSIFEGVGGAPAVVLLAFSATEVDATPSCDLLVGPVPVFPVVVSLGGSVLAPGQGDLTAAFTLPATTAAGTVYLQAFCADGSKPEGFAASNATRVTIH